MAGDNLYLNRETLDVMMEGCQIIDFDERYVYINQAAEKQYKIQLSQFIGLKYTEAWPGIENTLVYESLKKCLIERSSEHISDFFEFHDGETGFFKFSFQPVAEGVLVSSFDFTEKVIPEHLAMIESLRSTSRRLMILMGNLPGMAYRCVNDTNWTMQFISQGAERLTGYTASEMIDTSEISYGKLINWHDREMVWDKVQAAIVKNEQYVIEYRITDRSGREKYVWEQGTKVETDERGNAILEGFIMDITDRRAAENELRELKNNLEVEISEKSIELQARIKELERFYEATIDREFRIKELRQEIEELKKR